MSKLLDLEKRAVGLLEATPFFDDVLLRAPHHGDLVQVIAQRLAAAGLSKTDTKKPGLLVLCSVAGATFQSRPVRGEVTLTVAVLENPLVNQSAQGTGKGALAVAEAVLTALADQPAHAGVPVASATRRFALASPTLAALTADEKRARYGVEGGLGYECHFTVQEAL
jgi:hypothetical protein